jgi:hypothetical protein
MKYYLKAILYVFLSILIIGAVGVGIGYFIYLLPWVAFGLFFGGLILFFLIEIVQAVAELIKDNDLRKANPSRYD